VVTQQEKKPDEDKTEKAGEQASPSPLPSDFYKKLLHLPPCKTGGECNNCGRCEH